LHRWLHSLGAIALVAGVPIALTAWHSGPRPALWIAARVVGLTTALVILTHFVPFPAIVRGLERLRVPAALVELLSLAHRYTDVLGRTFRTARDAQRIRGGRGLGAVAGVTLARAYDRTHALGEAMAMRGRS
jgi:cobalt/nickel transport system permease protein